MGRAADFLVDRAADFDFQSVGPNGPSKLGRAQLGPYSHDVYSEYSTMRSRVNNYSPIPNLRAEEMKNPKEEEESMVKEIVCVSRDLEKTIRVVSEEKSKPKLRDDVTIEEYKPIVSQEACDVRKYVNPKPYGRSKSDKPQRVRRISDGKETKRKSYDRRKSESSKWMVVQEKWEHVEEESEEFSKMSNEELNRRVEDFIRRFNREIRLESRVSPT